VIRDKYNIIPTFLAGSLHVLLFAGMVLVYDFSRPIQPAVPLAINATLMTEDDIPTPEPIVEPPPEPEPVVETPEPEPEPEPEPQRDLEEERRQALEEQKRLEDLRAEQERIRLEEEAEQQRKSEEAEERRKREEAEIERRRQEAERKRQEDLERQRLENERQRRMAEEAELERRRQQELDEEANRLAAMTANDQERYAFAIQQKITRNFIRPASAPEDLECVVNVRQLPSGQVVDVSIASCNGDEAVRRAVEAAVHKASPLPLPANANIFQRNLQIIFKPEQ
jgi:colicin import membrane protein